MTSPGSPSLLARLRGTTGSIRKKFRKAQSLNLPSDPSSPPGTPKIKLHSPESHYRYSGRSDDDNRNQSFSCRFLGQMTIYTLNPEHCYGFAEGLLKTTNDGEGKDSNSSTATKCSVTLKDRTIEISVTEKRNLYKRKNHSGGTPPPARFKPNKHGGSTSSLHHHGKPVSPLIRQRTISCEELIEDPKRDTSVFRYSGTIQDPSSVSVLNPYPDRAGRPKAITVFDFPDASRVHGLNAMMENGQEKVNATIPLYDVAYCVTVPSNQRLFLLTSRHGTSLTCRVFLFSRREKAQALTMALAERFKKSFLEWQASKQLKRKVSSAKEAVTVLKIADRNDNYKRSFSASASVGLSCSTEDEDLGHGRPRGDSNKDSGHEEEDVYSSQEELDSDERSEIEAMSREFERRASCMDRPEEILVVGDMDIRLESICQQSDGFTSDDERESDENEDNKLENP